MYQGAVLVVVVVILGSVSGTVDPPEKPAKCVNWVIEVLQNALVHALVDELTPTVEYYPTSTESDKTGRCECDDEKFQQMEKKMDELNKKVEQLWQASFAPVNVCLMGMKDSSIPSAAITASSQYPNPVCYIEKSRLDSASSWCAAANTKDQWIQVDLGRPRMISGVVTQGRADAGQWVTEFTVSIGTDNLEPILEDGKTKIFLANTENKRKVYNRFPELTKARFVRIYPVAHHGHISMRFDLTSC